MKKQEAENKKNSKLQNEIKQLKEKNAELNERLETLIVNSQRKSNEILISLNLKDADQDENERKLNEYRQRAERAESKLKSVEFSLNLVLDKF